MFNEFNDIVFVGVDADFKKHVFKLATDAELIQVRFTISGRCNS